MDNSRFQMFVNEMPRLLWNALEGEYEVCIAVAEAERYGNLPVIVIKNDEGVVYTEDIRMAFAKEETAYGSLERSFEKFADSFAKQIRQTDAFYKASLEEEKERE